MTCLLFNWDSTIDLYHEQQGRRQFCSTIKTVETGKDEQNQKSEKSETQVGRKMASEEKSERGRERSKKILVEKFETFYFNSRNLTF